MKEVKRKVMYCGKYGIEMYINIKGEKKYLSREDKKRGYIIWDEVKYILTY